MNNSPYVFHTEYTGDIYLAANLTWFHDKRKYVRQYNTEYLDNDYFLLVAGRKN